LSDIGSSSAASYGVSSRSQYQVATGDHVRRWRPTRPDEIL